MARLHFELSDFAPLIQEIAKRRRPLLEKTVSGGPGPLQVHLDITLHALETIESAGPIAVVSDFEPGQTWIQFKAEVPRLSLKIPCTLTRGTLLIKDGDWPLDVNFECTITGQIHLIDGSGDEPNAASSEHQIQVAFENFELRCPAFPQWMETLVRPILERLLESIIAEMIPVELRRPLTASVPEKLSATGGPRKSGMLYWSAFTLGYGFKFPAALVSGALSRKAR